MAFSHSSSRLYDICAAQGILLAAPSSKTLASWSLKLRVRVSQCDHTHAHILRRKQSEYDEHISIPRGANGILLTAAGSGRLSQDKVMHQCIYCLTGRVSTGQKFQHKRVLHNEGKEKKFSAGCSYSSGSARAPSGVPLSS